MRAVLTCNAEGGSLTSTWLATLTESTLAEATEGPIKASTLTKKYARAPKIKSLAWLKRDWSLKTLMEVFKLPSVTN